MKKILLISDTHGNLDQKLIAHGNSHDEIWHAGDIGDLDLQNIWPENKVIRAVFGNIDGTSVREIFPETLIFDCEGVKTLIITPYARPRRKLRRQRSKPAAL